MKRIIALLLIVCCMAAFASCGGNNETPAQSTESVGNTPAESVAPVGKGDDAKSEGVMTYAEYMAAAVDDAVVIEAFVQGKQSWWEDKATVYLQDADGGYFVYNMECSQEDYDKLTLGTKVKVSGYKAEWSGEIEIAEGATFEIVEGSKYVAAAKDVTALLGKDELINSQNQFVAFNGLKVETYNDNGDVFAYKWDGSGADGDDLYFKASVGGTTYTFTVESYLCDKDSEVYKAVKNLKAGDTVDMEGFLYWYEQSNPQITRITVK